MTIAYSGVLFPPPDGEDLGGTPIGDDNPSDHSQYPIETWVVIDGNRVPCTSEDLSAGTPTIIDGLSFSWGRESIIDQPDTNTCAFTLREQVEPDQVTISDSIHVGSSVEIWSQAEVPVTNSETMQLNFADNGIGPLDSSRWTTVAGETPTITTDDTGVGYEAVITREDDWDWTTSVAFAPRPFDLDGTSPGSWDLVPRLVPGVTWKATLRVQLPPGSTATLKAWAYTGPSKDARAGACTVTGDNISATGAIEQMIGQGDGWFTITADVTLPADLDDPAGYWVCPGITLDPMPSPVTWAEAPGTWDDQVLRWIDLQRAAVLWVSLRQSEAAPRTALVWSGEVTSLVTQAAGYKAVTTAVTASDLSSILANVKVGDEPWPAQSVQDRADAIMALIPTAPPLVIDAGLRSTIVSYRDVDAQPPLGLLQDLAQTAGGVLWITAHATQGAYLWMEDPRRRDSVRRFAIDETGAVYITTDTGDTVNGVAVLSAMDVLRDPVQWTQDVSQVITQVSVSWLEQLVDDDGIPTTQDHTEVLQDTAAVVEQYGIRDVSVSTELTTAADAEVLASRVLALSRGTGWKFDGLQLDTILLTRDIPTVDYPRRLTTVLDLLDATTRIGYAVTLIDMPEWTPEGAVRSVYIDGGTYTWADWRWQLELTATPAAGQGESATWADFDGTGVTWDDFAPNQITWTDAYGTAGPIIQDQLEGAE